MMEDTNKKKKVLKKSQRMLIFMFAFSTLFMLIAVIFYPKIQVLPDDTFNIVLFTLASVYLIIAMTMLFLFIRANKKEKSQERGAQESSMNMPDSTEADSDKEQIKHASGPVKRACDYCGDEVMEGELCEKCGRYAIIMFP